MKVELAPAVPDSPLLDDTGASRVPDEGSWPEANIELAPPVPVAPLVDDNGESDTAEDERIPEASVELAPPITVWTDVTEMGVRLSPGEVESDTTPDAAVLLAPAVPDTNPEATNPELKAVLPPLVTMLGAGVCTTPDP